MKIKIIILSLAFSLIPVSANAIYKGESAEKDPLVLTTYGNGGCSATAIAPRILAMAQHCPANLGQTLFTYPGDDYLSQKSAIAVAKFIPSGNFLGGREFDFMLVVINKEFPVSSKLKIATEEDLSRWKSNRTEIVTYGFGETGDGSRPTTAKKAVFQISFGSDLGSGISPSYTSVVRMNPKNNISEICGGDSGGPSYVFENENIYYIGATISTNKMTGCGKDSIFPIARVQAMYPYMDLLNQANTWVTENPLKKIEPVKKTTIKCVKWKFTKKISGVNPKCPKGYKKAL